MARGYGSGRVGLGDRPAVLVIDFQGLLCDPESPMYGGEAVDEALSSTARLLRVAREVGLPVFYTTVGYRADARDMALWPLKVRHLPICVAGSRWTRIPEQIAPREDEIVLPKRMASAFFGTDLLALLNAARIDSVIVCGGTTGGCVRATVVDAFQYGLRALVTSSCTLDMDPLAHRVNLQDIDKRYGDLVELDQLLGELRMRFGNAAR
ncbi:MAG: isochorismatase family protein [Thermoleophilia bacterium]|nr:isochorismatase family protein [Thermoleophilia bacterium]